MTKQFFVYFDGPDSRREVLGVYAESEKEARFVAIESHPWLNLHPNHLLYVLENK